MIGLIDVDGTKFPNLCLMKISASWKQRGYETKLLKPADVLRGYNLFETYDTLFGACVFTKNAHIAEKLIAVGVHMGGTGLPDGNGMTLSKEVEHIMPDYSLYGITNTAYGFLTRGCPRGCPFCIVATKEGATSRKVADLPEWWAGQKNIKLLDPNLLAASEADSLLQQLHQSKAYIDFTQGIDVRLLNSDRIELLSAMKVKRLHFAWDNPKDTTCKTALLNFAKTAIKHETDYVKYKVYVLTNYWSSHEEDLYRVYWLRDNAFDPYVMIYDKAHAPIQTRHLQRWVNNKRIFRTVENFDEYNHVTKRSYDDA